jgi:hypothetical protein
LTRRDNQTSACARHSLPQSSRPPRHQILIQIVALFSSRLSRYTGAYLMFTQAGAELFA